MCNLLSEGHSDGHDFHHCRTKKKLCFEIVWMFKLFKFHSTLSQSCVQAQLILTGFKLFQPAAGRSRLVVLIFNDGLVYFVIA
jgi:hypothetical protein